MIVEGDSPLIHIPEDLDKTQAMFLDGIRFSIVMTELAYERLCETLRRAIQEEVVEPQFRIAASAVLDAWSMVDSIHRLRELLQQMRGLRRSPELRAFLERTKGFEDLRHIVQHLRQEINALAMMGSPVWGQISWFILTDLAVIRGKSCVLVAGRIIDGHYNVINPAGRPMTDSIGYIELRCKDKTASLSQGFADVSQLCKGLENALREQFAGKRTRISDTLMCLDMEFPAT